MKAKDIKKAKVYEDKVEFFSDTDKKVIDDGVEGRQIVDKLIFGGVLGLDDVETVN